MPVRPSSVGLPPIPVMAVGADTDRVEKAFSRLIALTEFERRFGLVSILPEDAQRWVLLTDDLRSPSLRDSLRVPWRGLAATRGVLLHWDSPLHLEAVVSLPLESAVAVLLDPLGKRVRAALGLLARDTVRLWADRLGSDVPSSLALAVRVLLRRSSDALGPPPPRSLTELARLVSCDRSNLSVQATRRGVDLPTAYSIAVTRWLSLRMQAGVLDAGQMADAVGYHSTRGLQRLVRRTVGVPLGRLGEIPVRRLDAALSDALGSVTALREGGIRS